MKSSIVLLVTIVAGAFIAAPAEAQPYPNKPVRIITANSAGGTSDILSARSGTSCRSAGRSR
jgi:tripartite-type tricarboxylate transporter receptor subunit TctC